MIKKVINNKKSNHWRDYFFKNNIREIGVSLLYGFPNLL